MSHGYIEGPALGKAGFLAGHGGELLDSCPEWDSWPERKMLVVIAHNTGTELVLNGTPLQTAAFEVAAVCGSRHDYDTFTRADDTRVRQYVLMDRETVAALF